MVNKGEVEIVTKLRGVAALMVLFFHLFCLSDGYVTNEILVSVFRFGRYGVEFFFVISGFVITYSMIKGRYHLRDFFTFIKKRVIRIEPPFLVVLFLTVLYKVVRVKFGLASTNFDLPTFKQVALHFGYLIPFYNEKWLSIVFWTLGVEFQFYLLLSLTFIGLNASMIYRTLIGACLLISSFFVENSEFIFHWIPIFLSGIYLGFYKMAKIGLVEFVIASILCFVVIMLRLKLEIFIFSIIPFLLILFEPIIKSKVLAFFGNISYSIYLVHTLIIFPIISLGLRHFTSTFEKWLVVIFAFVSAIGCSYLLNYFIERPAKRIAAGISYSKR